MIPNCFGLTADLFTGYTFPFYHHHQVPSTGSRLAIMDLLFLRSMIKLWVHGGVPFYITLFFFLGIVCQHQKTASSTVLRSVL